MKRVSQVGALITTLLLGVPLPVSATMNAMPDVIITELQTASSAAASEEFIELYNTTDQDIDFADKNNNDKKLWKIQYFDSKQVSKPDFSWDTTSPSGTIVLSGKIAAHDYYLLSVKNNERVYAPGSIDPDQSYSGARLADKAGGLQLVDVTASTITRHDRIGWSSATPLILGFYVTPQPGGSLQRTPSDKGEYIDSDGKLKPFIPMTMTSPRAAWQPSSPDPDPAPPAGDPSTTPGQPGADPSTQPPQIASPNPETLQLSELLPNPAAPATDAKDEFVEIYNYGEEAVELAGFTIQTGNTFSYSYTISSGTLPPHDYIIFTSGDTPLTLSNSGGRARLLNAGGKTISETSAYSDAQEGAAWIFMNGSWQWSASPTPGAANVLTLPPAPAPKAAAAKKPAAPKAAAKTSTKKTAPKAVKAAKTTKPNANSSSNTPAVSDQGEAPPLHSGVLAGIGGLALVYGAYEYRQDVANRLHQLKRYRAARRAARAGTKGR